MNLIFEPETKKMEHLSIILTEKKNLGYVAIPFMVSYENEPTLTLIEQVIPKHMQEGRYAFTGIEKEIIESLYEINEQTIHKLFGKRKTLKQFFDQLEEKEINQFIRPYIEKKLTEAFQLVAASEVPMFIKSVTYSNLYISDKVDLYTEYSKANFHFTLEPDFLTYSLRISEGPKELSLLNRNIEEITSNPAALLINNHLYRFENIDSKKFKPFTEKSRIAVPARSIEKYMSSFVENCVRDHEVVSQGFEIKTKEGQKKALLSLEYDLSGVPVLVLKFQYDNRKYLAGTKSTVFVDFQIENQRYIFYKFTRDREWEDQTIAELKNMGLVHSGNCNFKPDHYSGDLHVHALVEWTNENEQALRELGIELVQDKKNETYYTGSVKLDFKYLNTQDWFDIYAVVKLNDFEIPFIRLRKNILNGTREYLLPNGQIFVLPETWFHRFSDMLQFAREEADHLVLDKMHFSMLPTDSGDELNAEWNSRMSELANFDQSDKPSVPAQLKATLRSYQHDGYSWMRMLQKHHFGGILADDMGLGKTLQAITLLTYLYSPESNLAIESSSGPAALHDTDLLVGFNHTRLPASLIVMPTSLIHNWENELRKFAPHLKIYRYTGNNRIKSKDAGRIFRHYHVVLTTYGLLRNDLEYLSNYQFLYHILDESQNIKNPTSKIYHAVTDIQSIHKLVLSGTPIENSLSDLWAQMSFVNKGLLGNHNFFKNHFELPITKNKAEDKELKLRKLIAPFILRRTKEMVAKELPPITEQILYCEMTPEQKQVYEKEKSGIRNEILGNWDPKALHKVSFMALQALTRLRLIANHPRLADPKYTHSSGKFEQILEHIDNIVSENHKLLVFSSFVKDLELLESALQQRHYGYAKLIGSTTDRQQVVHRFTSDKTCQIFLISLKAGGVGLNLTEADYVFVLNPWWNPAAEAQAINRAHRIGQTKNVFVYKFITSDTIEEKISCLQEKKLQLAESFITNDNPLKNLTQEEIEELFS